LYQARDSVGTTSEPIICGDMSKPCPPVVHIKIAGIYGCSSPLKMVSIASDP
jgi:hypothetical protein